MIVLWKSPSSWFFFFSLFLAYLSHLNVSDLQINFNIRKKHMQIQNACLKLFHFIKRNKPIQMLEIKDFWNVSFYCRFSPCLYSFWVKEYIFTPPWPHSLFFLFVFNRKPFVSGIKRTTAQAQPGQAVQEPEVALDEHLIKWVRNSVSFRFQTDLQPNQFGSAHWSMRSMSGACRKQLLSLSSKNVVYRAKNDAAACTLFLSINPTKFKIYSNSNTITTLLHN